MEEDTKPADFADIEAGDTGEVLGMTELKPVLVDTMGKILNMLAGMKGSYYFEATLMRSTDYLFR